MSTDCDTAVDDTYYIKEGGAVRLDPGEVFDCGAVFPRGAGLSFGASGEISGNVRGGVSYTVPIIAIESGDEVGQVNICGVAAPKVNTFVLAFDADGGTGAPSTMTASSTSATHEFSVPSKTPTKPGYDFLYWRIQRTQKIVPAGSTLVVSAGTTTLCAAWAWKPDPGEVHGSPSNPLKGLNTGTLDALNDTYYIADRWSVRIVRQDAPIGPLKVGSISPQTDELRITSDGGVEGSVRAGTTYTLNLYVGGSSIGTITIIGVKDPSKVYYLHFDANGGSGAPSTLTSPATSADKHTFTIPSTVPTKAGYEFIGWSDRHTPLSNIYDPGDSITVSDLRTTLYADWAPINSFAIAFDANGGSGGPSTLTAQTGMNTHTFTIPYTTPSRSGYAFAGWMNGGTVIYPGGSITVPPGTTTLRATWSYIYDFRLAFDANGGSGAPSALTASSTSSTYRFTIPSTVPTKAGFTFAGWYNSAHTTPLPAGSDITVPSGTTTLYASWEWVPGPGEVHGSAEKPLKGMSVGATDAINDTYYVADKWGVRVTPQDAPPGRIEVTAISPETPELRLTSDGGVEGSVRKGTTYRLTLSIGGSSVGIITIHGVVDPGKVYTLQFDLKGGSMKGPAYLQSEPTAADEYTFTIPDTEDWLPTKSGYMFHHWEESVPPTVLVYMPGDKITVDEIRTEIYAVWWEIYSYTLLFDANGGRGGPTMEPFTSTDPSVKIRFPGPEPVREGYRFLGWYLPEDPDNVFLWYEVTPGTTTFYAKWEEIVATSVSLRAEGDVTAIPQGSSLEFTADVLPPEVADRRIDFSLVYGSDANTLGDVVTSSGGTSTCRVTSSSDVRGDFTLRARSSAYPSVFTDQYIHVDRIPETHGTPSDPLTAGQTHRLKDVLGDTFYIREGTPMDLRASTDESALLVYADRIEPQGSGATIDSDGTVSGQMSTPGTYVISVHYETPEYEGDYTVTVTVVASAEVPATAVTVTGPTEVTAGERVTLKATVEPADASLPRVTFVAMNGRVAVVSQSYSEATRESTCIIEGRLKGEVSVRATSGDGAASTDHRMTVAPALPTGDSFTLDAGAGTFPNGESTVSGPIPEEGYLLPDWSVVDRPGFRLTGWTSGSTHGAMGQTSHAAVTWTAEWAEDVRSYGTAYLPHAAVRVYRALDEYIDLTTMCVRNGEPVVQMAENRPEMAVFSVTNEYDDPARLIIGDRCALWSKGDPGAIATGMYCTIEDIQADGSVRPIFDGFVSTIAPDADARTVTVTVGDRKTFYGRSGATLRRNYYVGRTADSTVPGRYDEATGLYGDLSALPPDSVLEPPYAWRVKDELSEAVSDNKISVKDPGATAGDFFKMTMPAFPFDTLGEIRIRAHCLHGGHAEYVSTGQLILTTVKGRVPLAYRVAFNNQTGDFSIDFDLSTEDSVGIPVSGPVTLELTTSLKELRGFVDFYTKDDAGSSITYRSVAGDTVTESKRIVLDAVGYTWHACEATREGLRLNVNKIDGIVNNDDPQLFTPPQDRVRINYLSEDISTVQIMSGIALASGAYPLPNTAQMGPEQTSLKVFRAGGAYTQDYLQKLADISSAEGRMRSFRARGFSTPAVIIGTRHRIEDANPVVIAYGGDNVPGAVSFSSFSPHITLKCRPNLVMVRGSGTTYDQRTIPLMVAVENRASTSRRSGMVVEQVLSDSSVNTPLGAARSGYSAVNANDLDRWEGQMVLPGIRTDLMELGGAYAGSGVPVVIHDSRNGLKGYRARVKEATLDYNQCTTTVTLVNYSVVYSSGLGDTMTTAQTAADVATGAGDASLYETQYVRVVSEVPQTIDRSTMMNRVAILTGVDGQTEIELTGIQFLDLPDDRTTMVAVGLKESLEHTDGTRPHDVQAVRINDGEPIVIPEAIRPDYYEGQTLIVNVDFPTR